MSFGRTHFAAVYVSCGKIFVFGGRNSETGILRQNEVYDIKTAKWSTIRPLELGRCCHDASVVKSDVVLTGGYVQVAYFITGLGNLSSKNRFIDYES
jgi:hypothetical protein